ncbi:RNA-binding protein [Candidatus Micrarchaeota archaeon]|nr:RNA-binding protein [Candidatus Micrarchaeota archaeon]
MTRIVVPGELVASSPQRIEFAFIENGKTYSSVLGLFDEANLRVIPLEGAYMPAQYDIIVGIINEVKFAGYNIDINSPYKGFLSAKDSRYEYKLGDVISAKIVEVDEVKSVNLEGARALRDGEIIEISPVKIPRVIGKKNSMLDMIKEATKSEIFVGKNGRIWIQGGNSALAARTILKVEKEAHTTGLTERISAFLKDEVSR